VAAVRAAAAATRAGGNGPVPGSAGGAGGAGRAGAAGSRAPAVAYRVTPSPASSSSTVATRWPASGWAIGQGVWDPAPPCTQRVSSSR
jgi:hypothetical protein